MRKTKETGFQLKAVVLAAVTMIAVVLMMGMMTIISHAEEGRVTASSVKIRESADTNSEMLSGALQGDILPITGEVTGADGKVWYQVTFEGNRTGYIRSDLMEKVSNSGSGNTSNASTPASGVVAVTPVSATVSGEQVRVRSDASTSGSIVTTVKRDVVLTITGTATDSEGKTWYQVSFNDASGQVTGFVRQDFVKVEGEIVPADQVTTEPEAPSENVPTEPETPATDPQPVHKDFETQLNDDGWYLLDYTTGEMYLIEDLFDVAERNQELYEQSQAKLKSMKTIMIILVFVVILLALAATLLFFKIRDMMDAAYFEEVEKETIRNRQSQKAAGRGSMPTVGPGNRAAGGSQKPTGGAPQNKSVSGQNKTAGSGQQRPAGAGQQKTAGNGQQRPAGAGQQRPAGAGQQKPVGNGQQRPAGAGQQRTGEAEQKKTTETGQQHQAAGGKPVQQTAKPAQPTTKTSQQPKNFMADDDEFEFEFLNWDGEEDN